MKVHQGEPVWDGSFQLFGHDVETGDSVWVQGWGSDEPVFKYVQDVEALMERNKFLKEGTEGRKHGEWMHMGSVPHNIAEASGLNEAHRQRDTKWVKRFFNDSDNAAWRTSRGKV